MVLAVVSGVGVDRLHPQQGVVRQGVQGGGGGWGEGGRVGGEHGVLIVFKVHGSFSVFSHVAVRRGVERIATELLLWRGERREVVGGSSRHRVRAVRQAEVGVGGRRGGGAFTVKLRKIFVVAKVQVAVTLSSSGTHHQDLVDHPLHRAQVLLPQVGAVGAPEGHNASLPVTFEVRPFLHDLTHLSVRLSQSVDLIGDFSPGPFLSFSRHTLVKLPEEDVSVPLHRLQQQFELAVGEPRLGSQPSRHSFHL